jgi:hypothetical protein
VREPAAQGLRGDVDQLELLGAADHVVGHRLVLMGAGDPLDDVVEALQVLDVHCGQDVDSRGEQLLDVLPPLGVAGAGHVGVRQLVDHRDLGAPGQHGVDVQLLEPASSVRHVPAGHDLQPSQ